ncbi:MAG: ProQ/FINO family protein, partial [Burkholderiaceae bacterium]
MLEQLAVLYPQLFGAEVRPLKRGVFQDLMEAHPGLFARDELKAALGWHTRSTRYLQAVAAGQRRHDLSGQPVEDMAPEHVHHALLEVFRRRKPREGEDLAAKLRRRLIQAFEASGLTRDEYLARVGHRDAQAQAQLDSALAEWAERAAKDEALLRAFERSGQTVEVFAEMYGLPTAEAGWIGETIVLHGRDRDEEGWFLSGERLPALAPDARLIAQGGRGA